MNEADTCRMLVRPKLEAAGWDGDKHFYSEQTPFTDGRIIVPGGKPKRLKKKFSDFLLRYTRDITLGVVEAKSDKRPAGDGLQQAKDYAGILGLKFAYATNGTDIIEYDFFTGQEQVIDRFPTPDELWARYQIGQGLTQAVANAVLVPFFHQPGKEPRYYQKIAILGAIEAITGGRKRALLTMATGTGKTVVAFQICWKLWSAGWNAKGEHRKPRMLFLADRNILVDDPKDKTFAPFGDGRWKIATSRRSPPSSGARTSWWMPSASYRTCCTRPRRSWSNGRGLEHDCWTITKNSMAAEPQGTNQNDRGGQGNCQKMACNPRGCGVF
jgi:type I restriction enzyme R subunit